MIKVFWCGAQETRRIPEEDEPVETIFSGPLYRDDIFYSASLMTIPEYRKATHSKHSTVSWVWVAILIIKTILTHYAMCLIGSYQSFPSLSPMFFFPNFPLWILHALHFSHVSLTINSPFHEKRTKPSIEYHISVTRTPTQKEPLKNEAIKHTLATMLDLNLLRNRPFLILIIHSTFTSIGYLIPFMFINDRATQSGMSESTTFWLISALSMANTIGRIGYGIVSSLGCIGAREVTELSLLVAGGATMLSEVSNGVVMQFLYAAVYGFSVGKAPNTDWYRTSP